MKVFVNGSGKIRSVCGTSRDPSVSLLELVHLKVDSVSVLFDYLFISVKSCTSPETSLILLHLLSLVYFPVNFNPTVPEVLGFKVP